VPKQINLSGALQLFLVIVVGMADYFLNGLCKREKLTAVADGAAEGVHPGVGMRLDHLAQPKVSQFDFGVVIVRLVE
jgi:hypothetical protein